jgi:hypothetical protein
MANIPLTEKRFSEMLDRILEKRFNDMEERINIRLDGILEKRLDEKLKPIIDDLKEVKGFQKYEADAIELELQMVLKKHLSNVYPLMDIKPFEMKHISDPYTDNTITELDAAFLLLYINRIISVLKRLDCLYHLKTHIQRFYRQNLYWLKRNII